MEEQKNTFNNLIEKSVDNIDLDSGETNIEKKEETPEISNNSQELTSILEYHEIEEPCVALTIISENRLTDTEIFIKRGLRYSIKAFFSTIVLTIMNMFI